MKTLLDLLPASPNALLKTPAEKVNFLKVYAYFVELAIESFETFLRGDLQKFDAHVGDTACQIRAYRVLKLYHFSSTRTRLQSTIVVFQRMLEVLKEIIIEVGDKKGNTLYSLMDFLNLLKLEVPLDEDLSFLIAAFFLTQYTFVDDEIRLVGRIEYEKMCQEVKFLTRHASHKLVIKLQRMLTKDSCSFLEALTLADQKLHAANPLLTNTLLHDDLGRSIIPTFVSSYIIFKDMLATGGKMRLICKIDGEKYVSLLFQVDPIAGRFDLTSDGKQDQPCLVIKGEALKLHSRAEVIEYIERAGGVFQLLLANMAIHPQFSGQKFTAYNADFFNFLFSKSSAFLLQDSITWFVELYAKMLSLGKQFFEIERGRYFLPRHVYSVQC